MTEAEPDRPEPRGCTMVDLLALTLGAALASSLLWYSGEGINRTVRGKPAPNWYILGGSLIELLEKGGLALTPVILVRRWQYGGPLRPVDYPPIISGLIAADFSMSKWPIFGIYSLDPKDPNRVMVHIEALQAWEIGEIAVGIIAVLALLIRRRRPTDWAGGVLLAIAWHFPTYIGGYLYQQWANARIMALGSMLGVALLSTFLVRWPQDVAFVLPLAIAIVDLTRSPRIRRPWVDWAALAVSLPLPLGYEWRNLAQRMITAQPFDFYYALHAFALASAWGASYLLARWTEPAWRRFLGASPAGPQDFT